MSFHVVHVFRHGARLSKERGRLYCITEDFKQSLPIENIRAVIIAARGITLSSSVISSLATADAIMLHCGDNYRPVGLTAPLVRTINQRILEGQCRPRRGFNQTVWMQVLKSKVANQAAVAGWVSPDLHPLKGVDVRRPEDEGLIARMYFRSYFLAMGAAGQNRSRRHDGWLNDMLNYGYAVLLALVHRSVVIHGLMPGLGIHHRPRYRADPLVYDLMEPFRPVVDTIAAAFIKNGSEPDMERYARIVGQSLREVRLSGPNYSLKVLDWIDLTVRSFANACEFQDPGAIKLPGLMPDAIAAFVSGMWQRN